MPSRKPLHKYGDEYRSIFLKAASEGIFSIKCIDVEPEVLRKELYNYRQALREDLPLPPTKEDAELLRIAEDLKFLVKPNRVIVTINTTVYSSVLRSALKDCIDE